MNVVVLGASDKPERYSYKAVKKLLECGHTVFPVNPAIAAIDGIPVFKQLSDLSEAVHTVTVYLAPERSTPLAAAILKLTPRWVIFNPGAENPALAAQLNAAGIEVLDACTLVMLNTSQFG